MSITIAFKPPDQGQCAPCKERQECEPNTTWEVSKLVEQDPVELFRVYARILH